MEAVAAVSLTMEEVGDELRQWLSLRRWSVAIEENGANYRVELSEHDDNKRVIALAYDHAKWRPVRALTLHVRSREDVATLLEEFDCFTHCGGFGRHKCRGLARVTDEEIEGADQSYLCDSCGKRWGA